MAKGDDDYYTKSRDGSLEYEPCKLTDFSRLDLSEPGVIRYRLYNQDGQLVPMTVADTYSNRLFVSWVQMHDRYTRHGPQARDGEASTAI